jgi:gliding motility-associated protein GldC
MKQSEIKFKISLDDDRIPESISWSATDSGTEGEKPCLATMMSIWDPNDHTTLRIDLWTRNMLVDDMKRFFYENFTTMADTYRRATNDEDGAQDIRKFAEAFGRKTGIAS